MVHWQIGWYRSKVFVQLVPCGGSVRTNNNDKNAFQWDTYRPLVDCILACTGWEGGCIPACIG